MPIPTKSELAERVAGLLPKMHAELKTAQADHVFRQDPKQLAQWALEHGPTIVWSMNQLLAYDRSDLACAAISADAS